MSNITAVKELREKTGCGIADCNKALKECEYNVEDAVAWLRKKGLSSAAKKSGRITAEGLVCVKIQGNKGVVVEVNSETDFVAKNESFQEFVDSITTSAFDACEDVSKLKSMKYSDKSNSIEEELVEKIGVIGENINIRRIASVKEGEVIKYVHGSVADGMGKIGVLLSLKGEDKDKMQELGKNIAMHIAATKPEALNIEGISADKISKEKEIYSEQAKASGKPDNIIEKMVEGRLRKFYEDVVLMEQSFVMDNDKKIKDLVKEAGIEINDFKLFVLGEGIEKEENNFADEVASMASN